MTGPELSAADQLSLGLSRTYYVLARALRLNKLRDLLSGAALDLQGAPVWLLGSRYACPAAASEAQQEEALALLLHHFHSIPWMTYRTSFTPIAVGEVQLRSDAGWGCTLRSGQMILAQGLQRHLLGRDWRWPQHPAGGAAAPRGEAPPELARLLQLFWDAPAERNAFSLHNLCLHGRRCGVVPGRWLGPWVVCKTLEAAAAAAQVHHDLGVTVALLAEAGGGAPLLIVGRFESVFEAGAAGGGAAGKEGGRQRQDRDDPAAAASAAAGAAAPAVAESDSTELVSVDSSTLAVEAPSPAAALAASTHQLSLNGGGGGSRGLILLVPLVLGLGKLNPRYAPQLEAVLTWPQSIGIVGGRPSSSLYFVGCQAAPAAVATPGAGGGAAPQAAGSPSRAAAPVPPPGQAGEGAAARQQQQAGAGSGSNGGGGTDASVVYLDPHQVQEAACSDGDWRSFQCEAPRSMPLTSIDPSLALGFYCGSLDEYRDLCSRLAALERASGGAPLVCVATQEPAAAAGRYGDATEWVPDEMSSEGEEEAAEEGDDAAAGRGGEAVPAAAQQRSWLEEEPEVLGSPLVAEATAAVPSPPGSKRGSPGEQQQQGQRQQAAPAQARQGVSPRQMSRGWELL